MKFNKSQRARLYALTAVAAAAWLAQSLMRAQADGTLMHWSTIIFSICLLIVVGYTAYCAVSDWNAPDDEDDDENKGDTNSVSK